MDGAVASSASPSGVQGVCPANWHVPSDAEWTTLITNVEADPRVGAGNSSTALRSTSGWQYGNGTDVFGFRGIPGYLSSCAPVFNWMGNSEFWTSSEVDAGSGATVDLMNNAGAIRSGFAKCVGQSVRCVKN
jgi:uncharacterized protein (TIGR02145 family)